MITEKDLQEAIAECQGVRNPSANTCLKLAAFLTIQRELFGNKSNNDSSLSQVYASVSTPNYSYDAGTISYDADTEFARAVNGMDRDVFMKTIEELMETLQVIEPRLYASVMRKLKEKH